MGPSLPLSALDNTEYFFLSCKLNHKTSLDLEYLGIATTRGADLLDMLKYFVCGAVAAKEELSDTSGLIDQILFSKCLNVDDVILEFL